MPAKDIYHDTVRTALIKDGWKITDDPLILKIGRRSAFVDYPSAITVEASISETDILQYIVCYKRGTYIEPKPFMRSLRP
jgi:hypothetical protein